MASYLSGSNVQEDRVQTLHLMNPGYSGYADASNAGNLVLVNTSAGAGQNNSVDYSSQQQQHYIGFTFPPAITQSSLPQRSTLTTMYNSSVGQQNPSSILYTNRVGSNSYNWPAVNDLPLIPSNDVTQITQSLTARLTSMNSGQQSNSDISEFNTRRHSLHDEQASMLHNCVSLGLNMDSSQASDGTNRGLSLSLSSQQQSVQMQYYNMQPDESGMSSCPGLGHVVVEDGTNRGERIPNKWIGNLSHFRASSRDGLVGSGLHNSINDVSSRQMHIESNVSTVVGSGGLLTGSKYMKAAQQLLDEVVSVARAIKRSSSKHLKLQAWMAPSSFMDGSFARDGSLPEAVTTAKEGTAGTTSIPSVASGPEQISSTVIELTREERQDLQTKKAKLMAMLDEVDRRYKQYYSQMEIVVTSFESAAGLGAAKTYTALALQTISRHFRCLRDAISGQIRLANRALGEEDLSSPGLGRGETPRLRYLDQQLRQQRALQQLGMMQQHAWRPQRGLPERSVSILRAWLFEHFLHPYPKDADKVLLARQTGLTRSQVSNWFINARVRLWKPMVEEMYVEETKESDRDRSPSADQRSTGDKFRSGTGDEGGIGNPGKSNEGFKQVWAVAGGSDGGGAAETQMISNHQHSASDMLQQASARNEAGLKMAADSPAADAHLFQEKQGVKKARNSSLQRGSLAAATMLAGVDVQFKSDSNRSEESFEHESKNSLTMRRIDHALGDYHMGGGAERYAHEEFAAPRYANAGGGSNSVSLTLGLQHCDDLSLAGTHHQQHFHHHEEGHDDAAVVAAAAAQDYYSMNNSSNFEALAQLQSRKRFSQLLHHDFVA